MQNMQEKQLIKIFVLQKSTAEGLTFTVLVQSIKQSEF